VTENDSRADLRPPEESRDPNTVNWATVLAAAGVAALVAAIILTIGVVGLSRGNGDGQTIVVRGEETSTVAARPTTSAAPSTAPSAAATSAPGGAAPTGAGAAVVPGGAGDTGGGASPQDAEPQDAGSGDGGTPEAAPQADSGDFAVTTPDPSVDDLNGIVTFLTATDASDDAKRRNIESADALIVPQTVSRIGLFRAPRGGARITGPVERDGDRVTAQLNAHSTGIPDVSMPVDFVYVDGTWRLASSSICQGVSTIGLPIYCNA
jgi:hypothetical protein